MYKSLPERPNLDYYRKAARRHLREMQVTHPHSNLAAAQLAIAREHGFPSWRKLRMAIERKAAMAPVRAPNEALDADHVKAFADAINRDRGDLVAIRALLDEHPALANCQPGLPASTRTAIETVADLCVWHRPKMHEIAKLLIERGAACKLPVVARAGLLVELRRRLDADRSILDERDAKGRTALYRAACTYGRFPEADAVVAELLRRGAEVNIFTAAARLMIDELESILAGDRGAARTVDPDGYTALHWVTRTDPNNPLKVEIAQLLLDRGANVEAEARDDEGMRPLHCAAELASSDALIALLIDRGADVNARAAKGTGWTPLDYATDRNRASARDLLRARGGRTRQQLDASAGVSAPADVLPPHRRTHKVAAWKPIMDAAFAGDAKEITRLIAAGADPNVVSTTPAAHRPLHRAIEQKKTAPRGPAHEAAVKALLAGGADPKRRATAERVTALALAAMGSLRFVPLLVGAFEPLDLFHACILLDLPRVTALLKQDAALATARDPANGFTPLHYVTASALFATSAKLLADQLAIAQLLIDRGAGVNAIYVWQGGGEWPIPVLYRACGLHDNPALTELLMKAGAQPYDNESVYHAADECHTASLTVLAKHADKAKLAAECSKCLATQMHWGKSRGAAWLLAHGADPNALHDGSGDSALHSAITHGASGKVVEMLLAHGADPKSKNRDGLSAITLAKASDKPRLLKQLQAHTPRG